MSTTVIQDALSDYSQVAQAQYERTHQEGRKFAGEQSKLAAEAAKLKVDRFFARSWCWQASEAV